MIPLGKPTYLSEYEVWITAPVFSLSNDDSKAQDLPYYDVLVHRVSKEFTGAFYVDVGKLMELNLSERNPLHAKVFPAKAPKEEERVPLTPEEEEFRQEFQTYKTRKDMGMPMWRLSRRHVLELLAKLQGATCSPDSKSCTTSPASASTSCGTTDHENPQTNSSD